MGWGCPGEQGYTHDLARLIDFAISDSTLTVLSTLITKTTHLQGRWRVSFFWKRLKMYGMWMGLIFQGRSEELIFWDENRLMKFVCEAWWWWDETEEEETCGQAQLWAMNLRHLIFQLHWKNSLQQFSVLSFEWCCADIHVYTLLMHNYIPIYKLG